jgi:hypothetical protein
MINAAIVSPASAAGKSAIDTVSRRVMLVVICEPQDSKKISDLLKDLGNATD